MMPRISRGRLALVFAALVLGAWVTLPLLILEGPYGEVPIPGAATVHLTAGEVDVTLRTAGPAGDVSVPPLSMLISGPDVTTQPEVIERPRWKSTDSQGNMLVQVWVVHIAQEADYHIEVDGEVYGPYRPQLTFERPMWNEALELLVNLGVLLLVMVLSAVLVFVVVMGPVVLVFKLRELCAKRSPPAGRT